MDLASLYLKTKTLTVLLVEDHAPSRKEMEEILQDLFAKVVSVDDGEQALSLYQKHFEEGRPFDLVITDIQMPYTNGVRLVQHIKKLDKEQAVIVISAYPESHYLLDLINAGLSYFLTKPVNYHQFFDILQKISEDIAARNHTGREESTTLTIKEDLIWDSEKHLLKYQDRTINLSKNELLFIESLAKNGEKITTTQSLLDIFFYKGIDINENGIRNLVLRLRKKLPKETIHTVYGMGYKFHF